MPCNDVKNNGFDAIAICYIDGNNENICFLEEELA
jgi:hypothetical protein